MVTDNLPDWEKCEADVDDGSATALERFIYNNEPAEVSEAQLWRLRLAAALADQRERDAKTANSFEDNEYDRLSSKQRHLTAQAIAAAIRAEGEGK